MTGFRLPSAPSPTKGGGVLRARRAVSRRCDSARPGGRLPRARGRPSTKQVTDDRLDRRPTLRRARAAAPREVCGASSSAASSPASIARKLQGSHTRKRRLKGQDLSACPESASWRPRQESNRRPWARQRLPSYFGFCQPIRSS